MADPDDEKGGAQIVPDGQGQPNSPKPADTPSPREDDKPGKPEDERQDAS